MACLTSAIEPLRAANEITGTKTFDWSVVGEDKSAVISSANVRFDPDYGLAELADCEGLYVLSSPTAHFQNAQSVNAKLRRMVRDGKRIGGFSGGVFPLARSGILENKKCSVHWVYEAAFKNEFSKVEATDRVITIDGNTETASGSAAVFDLMLLHIEKKLGADIMTEVACWFQHPYVRDDNVAQRIPTHQSNNTQDMLPPTVAEAVKLFSEHVEEPLRVADVAALVNTSTRQLDRAFQRATGQSPLKYYRTIRLEKARQMVMYSSDPIAEIALAVGFSSSGPLVRYYKQAFGITPSDHRKQANQFRVENNAAVPAV
jgi:transcriptional regulator GlxA family with amidase domain